MAKEAFVSSSVYDLTGGLTSAPADDGYNIIGAAYTPTGPVKKTKVLSQKDFVNKYLTGSTVKADDHISVLFSYLVLAENPLYLIRACPVTILEGISSTGTRLLFDKSFNLLSEYFRFKINEIKDSLNYYYIKSGSNVFATGATGEISSEEVDGASIHELSEDKSIDTILSSLISKSNEVGANIDLIKSRENTIISRDRFDGSSPNIGKFTEVIKYGIYNYLTSSKMVDSSTLYVGELDYIAVDGTSYYFRGQGSHEPTSILNPTPISSPDNRVSMLQKYFLLKVLASANCDNYGALTLGLKDCDISISNIPYTSSSEGKISFLSNSNIETGSLSGVDTPKISIKYDSVIYNYYNTKDEVDEGINVYAVNASNGAEFITKVLDRFISKFSNVFDSSDSTSLIVDGNLTLLSTQSSGSLSSNVYEIFSDTDEVATYYYYLSNDANNKDYIDYEFLKLIVGKYYYYTGKLPEGEVIPSGLTVVKMDSNSVNAEEFKSLLFKNLYLTQKIGMYGDYFISTSELDIISDTNSITTSSSTVSQVTTDQFAVVQKFPSTAPVFKFEYQQSKDIENMLELKLNYKDGTDIVDWTLSFVAGTVDGYGVDQWFTRVKSDFFEIVNLQNEGELGDTLESYQSPSYGDKVGIPAYDHQYIKDAIDEVTEYEDDVLYDMVIDGGVIDPGVAQICQSMAVKLNSVYPASLPTDTSTSTIISYVGAANFNHYVTRLLAAADRESVAGFSKVIPGSIKLVRAILGLFRNKAIEFAPNFDLNHGTVGVTNLVQDFTKTERELLLDYKVESLKGGINTAYYINDNTTAQPSKSYMSEEQNVRMTNTAIHTLENFVKTYKAELNTSATRTKAQDGANAALQDRLFKGKQYQPAMYRAVCDDSNNTDQVINDNKLIIDLYASFTPSVKYILLKHYIVPLSEVQ
jgi:hypothetical protein